MDSAMLIGIHQIRKLHKGSICSDTPAKVLEGLTRGEITQRRAVDPADKSGNYLITCRIGILFDTRTL